MMTFAQLNDATLDQLTDELAAAGWDSTQTDIAAAREAVARLLCEVKSAAQIMTELDDTGFVARQDWINGVTVWYLPGGVQIRVEGMDVNVMQWSADGTLVAADASLMAKRMEFWKAGQRNG